MIAAMVNFLVFCSRYFFPVTMTRTDSYIYFLRRDWYRIVNSETIWAIIVRYLEYRWNSRTRIVILFSTCELYPTRTECTLSTNRLRKPYKHTIAAQFKEHLFKVWCLSIDFYCRFSDPRQAGSPLPYQFVWSLAPFLDPESVRFNQSVCHTRSPRHLLPLPGRRRPISNTSRPSYSYIL